MSYILEALQKAQAERQLGEAPTIHAPTLEAGSVRAARNGKRPLVLALVLMGAAVAGLLAMLLRSPAPATGAPAPAVAPVQASAAAPAAPAAPSAPVVAAPAATAPAAVPVAPTPAAPAHSGAAPATAPAKLAAKASAKAGRASGGAAEAGAQPSAPAAEAEERAQLLRELPEPIQRAIPPIAMSGYMYSKNPADRLILIDKVLRHEGEEVAPGLVLEKLQAKGAVFSFRGYRYRVPY